MKVSGKVFRRNRPFLDEFVELLMAVWGVGSLVGGIVILTIMIVACSQNYDVGDIDYDFGVRYVLRSFITGILILYGLACHFEIRSFRK